MRAGGYKDNDHAIIRSLVQAGYLRTELHKKLHIAPQTFEKLAINPHQYITFNQLTMIAGMLEVPILKVLSLMIGTEKKQAAHWYEEASKVI